MLIHLTGFYVPETGEEILINDGANYRAYLLNQRGGPAANPVFIEQANADAVDAGLFTVDTQTKVIRIQVLDYANREALIAQLQRWFKRGKRVQIFANFAGEEGEYLLEARVVSLTPEPETPLYFNLVLQSGWTSWVGNAAELAWEVDEAESGSLSTTLTVGGNDETRLGAYIWPADGISGYLYQRLYQLPNVPGFDLGMRPWCITLDTQALVTAEKMRSDCFDLRIYNGESEIKRWISGANTTTTKIWFNLELGAGYSVKLRSAWDGEDTLEFVNNATTKAALAALPNEGILYHGTEWVAYRGKPTETSLTVAERGIWGTTEQAHSAGDAFVYIQNPIRVLYGKSDATNPALDDDLYDFDKPLFDLSSSDNTKWVYGAATPFREPRPGGWDFWETRIRVRSPQGGTGGTTVSKLYDQKGDAESDFAMGIKAGAFERGSAWVADEVEMSFILRCPAGFSEVTTTGRKFRNSAMWLKTGLQWSADFAMWSDVWTEASPSAVNEWENWSTHTDVVISSAARWIRLVTAGITSANAETHMMTEALTFTAEFLTANLPTGTLGAEVDNYLISIKLENETNGDAVYIECPALFGVPFILDGESRTATFGGVNAHRAVRMNDEGRSVWIRLLPGENTLRVTPLGDSLGELSIYLFALSRRIS